MWISHVGVCARADVFDAIREESQKEGGGGGRGALKGTLLKTHTQLHDKRCLLLLLPFGEIRSRSCFFFTPTSGNVAC